MSNAKMTPERLNELAEMIGHDEVTVKEGREIAAFLRECAKAELVGEIIQYPHANFTIPTVSADLPVGTKLYAAPQVLSSIDERAEFEQWANKYSGGEPLQQTESGSYQTPFANVAYAAWQSRAKLSAPVVPDEKTMSDARLFASVDDFIEQCGFIKGWNDCRAAMLKGEK